MAMTRYLLDTNAMGDLINNRRGVPDRAAEARQRGDKIGTCVPVVAELYLGIEGSQTRERNRERLVRALKRIVCWPFDLDAAEEYGRVGIEAKTTGRPVGKLDMMIAAVARAMNCTVVTSDSDFSTIAGIRTVDWTTS
jgi:tRNA(fMet)-specific endonuclease VapC